jgi:VanZ family protein
MLGIVLEIIQLSIPTRFNNLYDLVGNTTGITIGIIAIGVFVSFMERKKAR